MKEKKGTRNVAPYKLTSFRARQGDPCRSLSTNICKPVGVTFFLDHKRLVQFTDQSNIWGKNKHLGFHISWLLLF